MLSPVCRLNRGSVLLEGIRQRTTTDADASSFKTFGLTHVRISRSAHIPRSTCVSEIVGVRLILSAVFGSRPYWLEYIDRENSLKCVWTPVSPVGGNSVMITILAISMVVRSTRGGTQLRNNLPQPVR